jgi:hypothetical protein
MGKNRKWIFIERELTRMRREFEKNNTVVPKVKGLVRNGNGYCVTGMQPKSEHVADGFIDIAERTSLDERIVLFENSAEEHGDEALCLFLVDAHHSEDGSRGIVRVDVVDLIQGYTPRMTRLYRMEYGPMSIDCNGRLVQGKGRLVMI